MFRSSWIEWTKDWFRRNGWFEKNPRNAFLHTIYPIQIQKHVFFAQHPVRKNTNCVKNVNRDLGCVHFVCTFVSLRESFLDFFFFLHIRRHLSVIFAHFFTCSALASSDRVVSNEVNVFFGILMTVYVFSNTHTHHL